MRYLIDDKRHLVCMPFSIENLHSMANDLGISRSWYHSHSQHPHYDVPKRRIDEIKKRCERVTTREIIVIIRGGNVVKKVTYDAVASSLSTAVFENGCDELLTQDPEQVATDICDHDSDFEGLLSNDPDEFQRLIDLVGQWQSKNRRHQ